MADTAKATTNGENAAAEGTAEAPSNTPAPDTSGPDASGPDTSGPDASGPVIPAPFILGGVPRWRGWAVSGPTILAIGVVALAVVIPLRGLFVSTGASMEEGFMLLFPTMVQDGKVPNVDFLHLYGPASLSSLAVWYRIFGDTLVAERTFGLLQHLAIISALYAIARVSGRTAACGAASLAALFVLTPIGLSALAWHGAVGLGLWATVFAVRALTAPAGSPMRARSLWWAGGLFGLALGFRPDLAVAALAVAVAVVVLTPSALRRQTLGIAAIGGVVGLIPMWAHLVVAGPVAAWNGMFVDPVFRLRPGRELPVPPSWGHVDGALQAVAESLPPWWRVPAPAAAHQLFLWFFAVIVVALVNLGVAWWWYKRSDTTSRPAATALLVGSVFGAGILPQALQRPDSTHLAWVAMVSWPIAIALWTAIAHRRRSTGARVERGVDWTAWRSIAIAGVVVAVICPFFTYRTYLLHTRVSVGDMPVPLLIERGDHRFWVGDPAVSSAMAEMFPELERRSEPGDRLFVGPGDLAKTVYADTYVYWMFPELEPSTYYIEMDPGLANAPNSGMASDVASADFVVLTNTWSGWMEPNTSVVSGDQASNEIIAAQFCLVESYNTNLILLFERCEGGGGLNPADIAGRAAGIGGGGVESTETP